VLDPLSGYLLLGQLLLEGNREAEGSWNFGPDVQDCLSVEWLLGEFNTHWNKLEWTDVSEKKKPHESKLLRLDCSKALHELKWRPVWNIKTAVAKTAGWYQDYYSNHAVNSLQDLNGYCSSAKELKLKWAS
jgi:CDP-glucose 4,6-dehydratase